MEGSGNGLVLFMGARTEHAVTSIQKFLPEVVYIVTSDDFKAQHRRRLKTWAEKYGFRAGSVKSVGDLFEETAVTSLLNEVISIAHEEEFQESDLMWHLGITGGTMHMAATGAYAALLLSMRVFYVIKPPEGMLAMPNRDVIEFPLFSGLRMGMGIKLSDIKFILEGKGKIDEFLERMPKFILFGLEMSQMIIIEERNWFLTEEGRQILEFVDSSMLAQELLHNIMMKTKEKEGSFIGWN